MCLGQCNSSSKLLQLRWSFVNAGNYFVDQHYVFIRIMRNLFFTNCLENEPNKCMIYETSSLMYNTMKCKLFLNQQVIVISWEKVTQIISTVLCYMARQDKSLFADILFLYYWHHSSNAIHSIVLLYNYLLESNFYGVHKEINIIGSHKIILSFVYSHVNVHSWEIKKCNERHNLNLCECVCVCVQVVGCFSITVYVLLVFVTESEF